MTEPKYTFGDLLQIHRDKRTIDVTAWQRLIDYYQERELDWQAGIVENKLFELLSRKDAKDE